MNRFSCFTSAFKLDLGDCDVLSIIMNPSDIIQRGVSVMNRRNVDAEGVRCHMVVGVMLVHHVVELPISGRRIAFAHMGLWMGNTFMVMMVVLVT